MNLHSSSCLQSKNINVIELFAMITVYKAPEDKGEMWRRKNADTQWGKKKGRG